MDTTIVPAVPVGLAKLCNFESSPDVKDCTGKVFARGYCEKHYRALRRAGAFDLDTKRKTPSDQLLANVASVKRARRKLLKHAPDFVDHLLLGSKIAAENGKTDAAQWAITHTRTIDPVESKATAPMMTAPTINIGVKVSGVDKSER